MRNAHARLIAVGTTSLADEAIPEVHDLITKFEKLIRDRFQLISIQVLQDAAATNAAVRQSLAGVSPHPGDVIIVAFLGHGIEADESHPYQAWALYNDEFTDRELADRMAHWDQLDTLVISGCCFGNGMFKEGPKKGFSRISNFFKLRQFNRITNARLSEFCKGFYRTVKTAQTGDNLIGIAAAGAFGNFGFVLASELDTFTDHIEGTARQNQTYGFLKRLFIRGQRDGVRFFVTAEPHRLEQTVLA